MLWPPIFLSKHLWPPSIFETPHSEENNSPLELGGGGDYIMGMDMVKGVFSDSNNIILWHKSEDTKQKKLISKISVDSNFTFSSHDYVCFIAPIDYSNRVEY